LYKLFHLKSLEIWRNCERERKERKRERERDDGKRERERDVKMERATKRTRNTERGEDSKKKMLVDKGDTLRDSINQPVRENKLKVIITKFSKI
jgi:hypothetical protein